MIRYVKHPVEEEISKDYIIKCNGIAMDAYFARVSAMPYNTVWPGRQRPIVLKEGAEPSTRLQIDPELARRIHKAACAMEKVGITHLASRCYRDLSGGQQQRVLLARAFCATEQLIFLDEPIAGLDPLAMKDMYSIIATMNRPSECHICDHNHQGVTVVMVSHDIHAAVKHASHILHLDKEQSFFGTTEEYLKTAIGRRFAGEEE